jgi:uncharacterized protein (DUF433 family)
MSAKATYRFLEPRPESHYRQQFIKGRRIRAEILYSLTMPSADTGEFFTPQQIADDYSLPLEAVQEAIAYCESNPPEIEADHRREERLAEASGMNHPDYKWNPKKYRIRLDPADLARILNDEPLPGGRLQQRASGSPLSSGRT